MVKRGVKNLTVVANDTAMPGKGIGKLITAGAVRKLIASHIGLNPETQKKMISGELEVELVAAGNADRAHPRGRRGPGRRADRDRHRHAGREEASRSSRSTASLTCSRSRSRATSRCIGCKQSDYYGNLEYSLTAHNFNPIMALAGEVVIAEPHHIVPVGVISPDNVKTPGVLVTHLLERAL